MPKHTPVPAAAPRYRQAGFVVVLVDGRATEGRSDRKPRFYRTAPAKISHAVDPARQLKRLNGVRGPSRMPMSKFPPTLRVARDPSERHIGAHRPRTFETV